MLPAMLRSPTAIARVLCLALMLANCGQPPGETPPPGESPAAPAAGTVVIAELDWDGARAVQHVLGAILEQHLGLTVELRAMAPATLLPAMDRGEIGVFPDLWMPDQKQNWERYVAAGSAESVRVNDAPYAGTQGLYVPAYVQEEHGIRRVEDLLSADAARLFDADGDGRGEYWPGPPTWSARNIGLVKARSYGFNAHFDALELTEQAFKQELRDALKARRPLLFYYWTPDAMHAAHDLRQLEEPAFDGYATNGDGCWRMIQPSASESWLTDSRITCATPDSEVYVAHTRDLAERLPAAGRFLKQVALTPELINGWTLLLSDYGMEPGEMARMWVEENAAIVDRWLASPEGR